MFAVVRTGGKQYRVAAGDKIVVEKIDGEAGDEVTLDDVLLAGEGSDLKSTDGLTVGAKVVAQAKGEKVTVFKKRRRHNYRRKRGHRQQHTILEIVSIGGEKKKAAPKKAEAKKADDKPAAEKKAPAKKAAKADDAKKSTKDAAPAKKAAESKKPAAKKAPAKKKPAAKKTESK